MSSSAHDGGRPGSLDDRMVNTDDLPPETATTMTEHATDPSGDASDLHADLTTIEPAAPPRVDVLERTPKPATISTISQITTSNSLPVGLLQTFTPNVV